MPISGAFRLVLLINPAFFGLVSPEAAVYAIDIFSANDCAMTMPGRPGGHISAVVALPDPAPPSAIVITNAPMPDGGNATITYLPDGTLRAEITDGVGVLTIASCPVWNPARDICVVTLDWGPPDYIELQIDFGCVGSSAPNASIPSALLIKPKPKRAGEDFSAKALVARQSRKALFASAVPKRDRIPGNEERDFMMLRDEVAQLADLLPLLRSGKVHHALGIAARLRLLLIPVRGEMGLLQRCAARVDAPLIVYTGARPSLPFPTIPGARRISLEIDGIQTKEHPTPIDVDDWLQLTAARLNEKDFTNYSILSDIGNTRGSHADPDLKPLVEMLENMQSQIGTTESQAFLATYICVVGEAIAQVARTLLSSRQ